MQKSGLTIRWDPELREKIGELAEKNHRSFAQEVAYLVTKGLEMEELRELGAAESVARYYSGFIPKKEKCAT